MDLGIIKFNVGMDPFMMDRRVPSPSSEQERRGARGVLGVALATA